MKMKRRDRKKRNRGSEREKGGRYKGEGVERK